MTMRTPGTGMSSASVPMPAINSTPAPGKRGPIGTSPRNNTSVVHTGSPTPSQVGLEAKMVPPNSAGMLPPVPATPPPTVPQTKVSEVHMGIHVARPTVQDMIKAAMAGAASRVDITREAARQAENLGVKTASEKCEKCDKEQCECKAEKKASYDDALRLADAVEYIADAFKKEANKVEPGAGPGALHVMESPGGAPISLPTGKHTALASETHKTTSSGPATQLKNDMEHPAGGKGHQELAISGGKGKVASILSAFKKVAEEDEKLEKKETEGMEAAKKGLEKAEKAHEEEKKASPANPLIDALLQNMHKAAEDAINPAHISAGAAVAPDTSAAGESGGAPVGGQPQGPTGLVGSNEAAINYTKGQAKAPSKADMRSYTNEPALKDDGALAAAFSHTGEAGTKMGSDQTNVKTAAARVLISKIREAAAATK
jgi:hypothetical protein